MDPVIIIAGLALVAGVGVLIYQSFHRKSRWVLNESNWDPNPEPTKESDLKSETNKSNLVAEEESPDHVHSTRCPLLS
jgi:hypothetical protein